MKRISIIIFLLIFVPSEAQTSIFDSLLRKNVDSTGKVDYQSLLQQFAALLLVSETEQSLKFGAGAGLVDSD